MRSFAAPGIAAAPVGRQRWLETRLLRRAGVHASIRIAHHVEPDARHLHTAAKQMQGDLLVAQSTSMRSIMVQIVFIGAGAHHAFRSIR